MPYMIAVSLEMSDEPFISYYKLIVQTISPCPLWILWYESLSGSNFSSHKHNIRDSKTDNCCCN